jgi:hypothetical protein
MSLPAVARICPSWLTAWSGWVEGQARMRGARALLCTVAMGVVLTACGSGAARPQSPQQIVAESAGALRRARQVTMTWTYAGYKGGSSSGRVVVTRTGARPAGAISGWYPANLSLDGLARDMADLTDFSCPPRGYPGDHLVRGPDSVLHGVQVLQLADSLDPDKPALIAERNPPHRPRAVVLLCGSPLGTGTTSIQLSDYQP